MAVAADRLVDSGSGSSHHVWITSITQNMRGLIMADPGGIPGVVRDSPLKKSECLFPSSPTFAYSRRIAP